jgi:hypothetical protein
VPNTIEPIEDSDNMIEVLGGRYKQRFAKDDDEPHYELSPKFGDTYYRAEIPASRWWEQIVNIKAAETENLVYRRKDVIMSIANKDRGAHAAVLVPEAYDVLSKPGGIITITMGVGDDTEVVPIDGVHLAMLRQIA